MRLLELVLFFVVTAIGGEQLLTWSGWSQEPLLSVALLVFVGGGFLLGQLSSPPTSPSNVILSPNTFANRPAAGTAGQVYHATDSPLVSIDNGTSWDLWLPGHGKVTPPDVSDFSWDNQGTATANNTYGS